MKNIFLFITVAAAIMGCNSESQNRSEKQIPKAISNAQTIGKNPKVDIKVNKQYDSKGNLIKYDSTYSYFHTSKGRDSVKIALDSVFRDFKLAYRDDFSKLVDKQFKDLFLSDTLFKFDFLNEDYFKKRFEMNTKKFDELFNQMDALKSDFLKKVYPEQPMKNRKKKSDRT